MTSTHIGEWARDRFFRHALCPALGTPFLWDPAPPAKRLSSPWIRDNVTAPITTMQGAIPPSMNVQHDFARQIKKALVHCGIAKEPLGIDYLQAPVSGSTVMAEARTLKLVLNTMVATMMEMLVSSAVVSPLLGFKRPMLESQDFTPAFTVEQMMKDLDIVLAVGRGSHCPMPLVATSASNTRESSPRATASSTSSPCSRNTPAWRGCEHQS
ncbi:MAG: NAD(P)-dependent oxidoreductase [Rhizobiales bacterium]|nr:NAD(P)-dependent oxidoreductase [Hyphomicrobiales bacterium]MBI3673870.1 NAD(P)-dependent oxidoreductase [Hyphomicrobiales bacterium]